MKHWLSHRHQAAESQSQHSLLLLDLHGEALHVGVFEVKAQVLPAEAQVRRHAVRQEAGGLREERGEEKRQRKRGGGGGEGEEGDRGQTDKHSSVRETQSFLTLSE